MTLFSLYEQKLIRLTDDQGNTFSGVADTFPAEYGLHEYGREEEGIQLGEYIIFKSQISKVEFLPTYEEAVSAIPPGRYRHFKGMEYEVIGIARHSETEEPMVVYRALYGDYGMWVRPASMWNERVARNGRTVNRFERIEMDYMSANDFKWTREPADYSVSNGMITVKTAPHTDLWQRTYYHFRNDNAPVFQTETEEKFFSFIVKTDFTQSHHRFDQCGIVMYLDSENWLKASVEYENESFQHLGSVVTNHGYSDWATTAIPADVKTMWYRFSRREDDYCIECSRDGRDYTQMRVCHMWEGGGKIRFGIYACSPEDSSFTAVFTDMKVTECAWKAHDGQQPD